MARKTYRLSDATFKALVDHEADIAKEMECDPSYIYGIKNQQHPDPFPKFRELYRATAHAGGDASYWRNELNAIDASVHGKGMKPMALSSLLLSKLSTDAQSSTEIYKAIEDGEIDDSEANRLLKVMETVRNNLEFITEALHNRLAELQKPPNFRVM